MRERCEGCGKAINAKRKYPHECEGQDTMKPEPGWATFYRK
jgi:hypothetical protein